MSLCKHEYHYIHILGYCYIVQLRNYNAVRSWNCYVVRFYNCDIVRLLYHTVVVVFLYDCYIFYCTVVELFFLRLSCFLFLLLKVYFYFTAAGVVLITDEAWIAKLRSMGQVSLFESNFCSWRNSLRFIFTSLQLVLCSVEAVKVSPYIIHSADYIKFQSFEIKGYILNNQKILICLDSCSRSSFLIILCRFWYYSVFKSTALWNLRN